jgi:deazaflavin-dependent oxidoreductase (nitroreductase family)
MEMKSINGQVVEEFRANGGKVSMFDYPLVILHTIGRNTGDTHLVPLGLITNDDDEIMLYGTFVGSKTDPIWAHNLRANPEITVETATETFPARIEELSLEDAKVEANIMAGKFDQFAEYITLADPRPIPVFKVHRL